MGLSIALVGMPGSGKSTVGRHLARQLGWRFVDSDHEIEQRIGSSIRAYFEQHGEAAFRQLEQQVLAELAQWPACVLATGGGAVLRAENRAALAAGCQVFYLRSTPEELFKRLRHDTQRPLLQVKDPLKRLRELFAERDGLYREAAAYTLDTARPTVPALVNMILMQLEMAGALPAMPAAPPSNEAGNATGAGTGAAAVPVTGVAQAEAGQGPVVDAELGGEVGTELRTEVGADGGTEAGFPGAAGLGTVGSGA